MWGLIRDLFSAIDSSIYSFITYIYRILMNIADVQIFSAETLKTFSERVYALLAIFMAFKLIFSFINYAVNPDQLTNEKTGGKKLILNIMISLVLLIAVPGVIFPLSRKLQYAILDEGILQEIILGVDQGAYSQTKNTLRAGRSMSYSVFTSFFSPNPPATDEAYCNDETIRFFDNGPGDEFCDGGECANSEEGLKNLRYQLDGKCAKAINDALEGTDVDAETVVTNYERAYNQFSTKILLGGEGDFNLKRIKTKDGEFLFDYKILLSTIAGIAVGWMLVVFCFQIAVRTIKLGFLELVAPIPILSYIDSKAKSKSFDGWVKSCISAYLDLFVRLAALYFAIFVISSVSLGNLTYASNSFQAQVGQNTESVGLVVKFFIIMGALMFASQVPKLIEQIFGIKLDGNFSINPFKNSPLASKALGGAVGLAAGAALGTAANAANIANKLKANSDLRRKLKENNGGVDDYDAYRKSEERYKWNLKNTVGSFIGGFAGGGTRSMLAGYKDKNGIKGAVQGVTASSRSRNLRETGYGGWQRAMNKWTDMAGVPSVKTGTTDTYDSTTKEMKQNLAYAKQSEQGLSQAVTNMLAQNAEALNGVVDLSTGKMEYSNYNEYIQKHMDAILDQYSKTDSYQQTVSEAIAKFGKGTQESQDYINSKAIEVAQQSGRIASEELYNKYENITKQRDDVRKQVNKMEKEIKHREEIREKQKK